MAKSKNHLVPVKKMVTRGGKTYETTVLVNPDKLHTVDKLQGVPLDILRNRWEKIDSLDALLHERDIINKLKDVASKDLVKEELVDFLAEKGVTWDRSQDFAIDYMRAMSKAKQMLQNGDFEGNINNKKVQPYKPMKRADARKLCQKLSKKYDDDKLQDLCKQAGVKFKPCDHKGVNHMRMMMAIREYMEEGKELAPMIGSGLREKNPKFEAKKETKKTEDIGKDPKKNIKLDLHYDVDDFKDIKKEIEKKIKNYGVEKIEVNFQETLNDYDPDDKYYEYDCNIEIWTLDEDVNGDLFFNWTTDTFGDKKKAIKKCKYLKQQLSKKFGNDVDSVKYVGEQSF